MAVCVYTKLYGDVAIGTVFRTAVNGFFFGFQSPQTRRVFNQGKRALEEMECFGNHLEMTERNKHWKAAVNYFGRKIDGSSAFDSYSYRI